MTGKMFPAPEKSGASGATLEKVPSSQKVAEDVGARLDELMKPGHVIYVEEQPSLRDTFAVGALTGIMMRCQIADAELKTMTTDCYKIADAMMLARRKK